MLRRPAVRAAGRLWGQRRWLVTQESQKPFLIVGEGLIAPFLAACLREVGLSSHVVMRSPAEKGFDSSSITLTPAATSYLTDDLGLAHSRPPGNMLTSFYLYDHSGALLQNLNLDSLREDGSGTFFCCNRRVIERLLLRECARPQSQSGKSAPIRVYTDNEVLKVTQTEGGVSVRLKQGKAYSNVYRAIINVSRDPEAVPLINGNQEMIARKRRDIVREHERAMERAPLFLDWTIPAPSRDMLELHHDEIAEVVHRGGRKFYVRSVNGSEIAVTISMPRRARVHNEHGSPAVHFKALLDHWETEETTKHKLFQLTLVPAMQEAIRNSSLNKVDFHSPTYCFKEWTEEGGKYIRIGPAAHGATVQAIDVADAVDMKDCHLLAERLAEHGLDGIDNFLTQRREEAVDELSQLRFVDDFALKKRSRWWYAYNRQLAQWMRSFTRAWKRALRPFV